MVLCGLLELLLTFCYVSKVYDEEYENPEIAWNIVSLSPSMSYLEASEEVNSVINNFLIRSLTFPLYRKWELGISCLNDAVSILRMGKGFILKALISLRIALNRDDCRYVFSRILLNDYCGWIQSDCFKDSDVEMLVGEVENESISKDTFSFISLAEVESLLDE